MLVTANASYLSGERHLLFNYEFLNTAPPVDCCGSMMGDAPGWSDGITRLPGRRLCSGTTAPASQRKRRLDRYDGLFLLKFSCMMHNNIVWAFYLFVLLVYCVFV